MEKQIVTTNHAPAAIGPYSQGVIIDNLLFISGQLPLDPSTSEMVEDTMTAKTKQILKNSEAIAKKAGSKLNKTVKSTIFLTDLGDFQEVNQAYAQFFPTDPPARSTVQVAALPLGSSIEIEFIVAM